MKLNDGYFPLFGVGGLETVDKHLNACNGLLIRETLQGHQLKGMRKGQIPLSHVTVECRTNSIPVQTEVLLDACAQPLEQSLLHACVVRVSW